MPYQQSLPYAQHHQQRFAQPDVASGDQYCYSLTNSSNIHEKVQVQRKQPQVQESQVTQIPSRITLLEDGSNPTIGGRQNENTVDDFSIKTSASQLDSLINQWAADVIRAPPVSLPELCSSILNDVVVGSDVSPVEPTPMQVQSYLRHALAEAISEGIINCLIVTNSMEANYQLTRLHEHIYTLNTFTPDMSLSILYDQIPELMKVLNGKIPAYGGVSILESAYAFSRMLHASGSPSSDAFYRAFVLEPGSEFYPCQIELVKRCLKSERGGTDRVGATVFPGLIKCHRAATVPGMEETVKTIVRPARVICECAIGGPMLSYNPQPPPYEPQTINELLKFVPEKSTHVKPNEFNLDKADQVSISGSINTFTDKKFEDDRESAASIYSVASSSTSPSDYGLYYKRMALSEESLISSLY